jgi:steroid delta-isomerase
MEAAADGRQVLDRYFTAIAALDPAAIAACFRPDGELEDPIGTPVRRGRDEIREYWARGLCAAVEKADIEVLVVLPAGDSVAAHWRMAARSRGGAVATAEGIDVLRFDRTGLIRRAEGYWDQGGFRDALVQPTASN